MRGVRKGAPCRVASGGNRLVRLAPHLFAGDNGRVSASALGRAGGRVKLRETYTFAAPVERVWDLLLDPDAVAGCIRGARSVALVGEDEYRGEVTAHVGPFPVTLNVRVTLRDKVPPGSCTLAISVEGAGCWVEGSARLRLDGADGQTTLHVEGEAEAGGLLAGFGGAAAGDAASRLLRDFFTCLQARCQGAGQP